MAIYTATVGTRTQTYVVAPQYDLYFHFPLSLRVHQIAEFAFYSDKQNRVQNLKCQLSRAIPEITMIPF